MKGQFEWFYVSASEMLNFPVHFQDGSEIFFLQAHSKVQVSLNLQTYRK